MIFCLTGLKFTDKYKIRDMYIIELFIKWLNKNKRGEGANPDNIYAAKNLPDEEDEALNCKHNFMPVDSTGTVLACTKCGFVVKRRENR